MRAILALFIAVAFVMVGTSAAAPGGEVKSSPLFKHSLEESIAKLEGQAPEAEAEPMPTGKPGCPKPNALPTEAGDTCYDSCNGTCSATCGGPFTCGGSTCSGATCSSTCAGGSCQYHYIWRGTNKWVYNGQESGNWNDLTWPDAYFKRNQGTGIQFLGSNPPPSPPGAFWFLYDGNFETDDWYSSPVTNIYDVVSRIEMRNCCGGPWTWHYAVLHNLSPPDDTGYGHIVKFYFYD